MKEINCKRLSVNLDEDINKIAEEKAKLMFKGNMDYYINWLICSNNTSEVKKVVLKKQKLLEQRKPIMLEGSVKSAMYNNTCEFCNETINQGEEICKAEGYENYIHKRCCKKVCS